MISDANARVLLASIKKLLNERGIPLNTGCQNLDEIATHAKGDSVNNVEMTGDNSLLYDGKEQVLESGVNRISNREYNKGRYSSKARNKNCFICNKPNHIAAECTNQYCQRCGTWGHGIRNCNKDRSYKNQQINSVINEEGRETKNNTPDETVIVDVKIEGHKFEALLDSGAGVSVTDIDTVRALGLEDKILRVEEDLRAFDNDIKKSIGSINLHVKVCKILKQQIFKVIKSKGSMTTVLGRDFLSKHSSTEFDWQNGQVRLGKVWLKPKGKRRIIH